MARIHELVNQIKGLDSGLAEEISKEVAALSNRREFGLNFERHTPEQVELPGRQVRKGDKVHILAPRGETSKAENKVMWVVMALDREAATATVRPHRGDGDKKQVALEDLVVVAEFRDPIYPGLVSTGKVENGGDKPFHSVINAENFHALEALLFTHAGKVDAIYIDPPYNTGARDWKYNNDYVEQDDAYRHSKWLAFMERRLLLAKELLNPDDSALIVTIDEKEYLRLGLLLEQTFPEAAIQMVTSVIHQAGSTRRGQFSRAEEYIFYVLIGDAVIVSTADNMLHSQKEEIRKEVVWRSLRRTTDQGRRAARPNMFYPIFVNKSDSSIHSVGDALPLATSRETISAPAGTIAIFPIKEDGVEMRWGLQPSTLRTHLEEGWVKWGNWDHSKLQPLSFSYLASGAIADLESGKITITGRDANNSVQLEYVDAKEVRPMSVWNRPSHAAGLHGSMLLNSILPNRHFPFPKSLYAVEDSLRFVVGEKPDAVIVDFFSGSGTTCHAVMRLNRQDSGSRTCISITNNEVSDKEQKDLIGAGLRPGDADWEKFGICDYITKPRLASAITGVCPDGKSIQGSYKFADEFEMAEGFNENIEFFTLTYEVPLEILSGRTFSRISPLLWMRAGCKGGQIDEISDGWGISDHYAILIDLDKAQHLLDALSKFPNLNSVFIFTNEDRLFQSIVRLLPTEVEPVRMYESFIRNSEQDALGVNR
jgi:adenine-specific DNA-methyltransferase